MRSFIVTIFLFIIICLIIFFNNLYIKSTASHITELVESKEFDDNPNSTIKEIEILWEKKQRFVSMSVGYKELDRMSDLILDLKTYFELGNIDEVKRIRVLIVEAAAEISRLERFSIENIL